MVRSLSFTQLAIRVIAASQPTLPTFSGVGDSDVRRERILAVVVIVGVLLAIAAAFVLSALGILPDPGAGSDIWMVP